MRIIGGFQNTKLNLNLRQMIEEQNNNKYKPYE